MGIGTSSTTVSDRAADIPLDDCMEGASLAFVLSIGVRVGVSVGLWCRGS